MYESFCRDIQIRAFCVLFSISGALKPVLSLALWHLLWAIFTRWAWHTNTHTAFYTHFDNSPPYPAWTHNILYETDPDNLSPHRHTHQHYCNTTSSYLNIAQPWVKKSCIIVSYCLCMMCRTPFRCFWAHVTYILSDLFEVKWRELVFLYFRNFWIEKTYFISIFIKNYKVLWQKDP